MPLTTPLGATGRSTLVPLVADGKSVNVKTLPLSPPSHGRSYRSRKNISAWNKTVKTVTKLNPLASLIKESRIKLYIEGGIRTKVSDKKVHRRRKVTGAGSSCEECGNDQAGSEDHLQEEAEDEYDFDKDDAPHAGMYDEEGDDLDPSQIIYLHACRELSVIPAKTFYIHLPFNEMRMRSRVLGPDGAKACAIALVHNIHVTVLDLSGNNMGNDGAAYMAEMIRENTFLTELTLAENKIASTGLKILSHAIMQNRFLRSINLSGNDFRETDAEYIADIIENNKIIKELYLSHNSFRELGGEILGSALGNNDTLNTVDLSWNHLRMKGAVAICEGLTDNVSIKHLNLAWNGFSLEGCKAMAKALTINRTLKSLDLSCNRINMNCLQELVKGLKTNEGLQSIRLTNNHIGPDGATILIQAIANSETSILRHLDIKSQCVNNNFIDVLVDLRDKRPFEARYGQLLVGGCEEVTEDDLLSEDPMMVLLEFSKQKNLRLVDLFLSLDTDGSKSLTFAEFKTGLMDIGLPISPKGLDKLLHKLDKDGDGEVDYGELMQGQKEHKRKTQLLKQKKDDKAREEAERMKQLQEKIKNLLTAKEKEKKRARAMSKLEGKLSKLTTVDNNVEFATESEKKEAAKAVMSLFKFKKKDAPINQSKGKSDLVVENVDD